MTNARLSSRNRRIERRAPRHRPQFHFLRSAEWELISKLNLPETLGFGVVAGRF
jgi:hypothetical protein